MRILVIEDDKLLARLIARFLAPFADDVTVKHSITEAFAELSRNDVQPADIITLDLNLPDSKPPETLARIRDIREKNPNAVIIIITGILGQDTRAGGLMAGADEVIEKEPGDFTSPGTFLRKLRDVAMGLIRQPVRYKRSLEMLEAFAERLSAGNLEQTARESGIAGEPGAALS